MTEKQAAKLVDELLANMANRRGFKLDSVDAETRREWRKEWISIVLAFQPIEAR